MGQLTFAELEYDRKKRRTRREFFLERMEQLIPWERLEGRIEPFYPKAGCGRQPYPLGVMLRVHCVQLFYNLSDPRMENLLYEAESVRRFVGLRLTDALPDETMILNFRYLLEKHDLGEGLFGAINAHLASCGHRMKQGTIVDATLIAAPSSTKNRRQERDPEMHQAKKGNQWHFGMKAHIGVDATSGLTHSVATTAGPCVGSGSGTPAVTRRRDDGLGRCRISRHRQTSGVPGIEGSLAGGDASGCAPPTGTGRPCEDAREVQGLSVRAKVEHPFLYVKRHFGYAKVRYRGLAKNTQRLALLLGFTNPADCRPPRSDLTRDESACRSRQAMQSGGNRAPEAIGHSQNAPSDRFSASISNFPVLNELVQTFPSSPPPLN